MRPVLPSLTGLRQTLFVVWAAVVLATVGLQATAPLPAPLEVAHGSAFSATTAEVALATRRLAEPARPVLAPQPLHPAAPRIVQEASTQILIRLPAQRPDSTGPPPPQFRPPQALPRAPPVF